MKKYFYCLVVLFNCFAYSATASEVTYETCSDCLNCGTNCKYTNVNGKLTIYGPTQTDSSGNIPEGSVGNLKFRFDTSITDVEFKGNITTIGQGSFADASNLTNVILNNVTTINGNAFQNTNLTNIDLKGVSWISDWAFHSTKLKEAILDDSVRLGKGVFYNCATTVLLKGMLSEESSQDAFYGNGAGKVYCQSNASCENRRGNVTYYGKDEETNLYVLFDEDGNILKDENDNPLYFIAPELIVKNKGCVSIEQCSEIVDAINHDKSFLVSGKSYRSLSDWVEGNYERKRIYTIDEAERASRKTGNKFKLRYK